MTIQERLSAAAAAPPADLPGPGLLPGRRGKARPAVLPVDGAGISLFFVSDRRLPLGASDNRAAEAERLQFTVGEGPFLSAHAEGRALFADEDTIRSRWPTFYDELATRSEI